MELERAYFLASKQVDGNISQEEREELKAWMDEDPSRGEILTDLDSFLGDMTQAVNSAAPETDLAWTALLGKISVEADEKPVIQMPVATPRGNNGWKYAAAAAVALLLMVGGYVFLGGEKGAKEASTYATTAKERKVIDLPDGSKVHLNSGSTLVAEAGFGGKSRKVRLEGEAYFDVASDPSKPFEVTVGSTKTTVLGTEFNLRSYRNGDPVHLDVAEGKVRFSAPEIGQEEIFTANQSGKFDPATRRIAHIADPANESAAWRQGVLSFKEEALANAIPRLNHFYDIDIRLGAGLEDAQLTARFEGNDETAMLDILATTYSAKVRREGKVAWLEK